MKTGKLSRVIYCIILIALLSVSVANANTFLNNGIVNAEFDARGLVSIQDVALGKTVHFQNDNCSVTVGGVAINTSVLTPTVTSQANSISFLFTSGNYRLRVIYQIKAGWRFVSRQIELTPTVAGTFRVNAVTSMSATVMEPNLQPYRATASTGTVFLRLPLDGADDPGTGLMLVQQNNYLNWTINSGSFTMSYSPDMDWKDTYGPFMGDRVCIGTYQMIGSKYPASTVGEWAWSPSDPVKNGMDWAEIEAAQNCIRAFLLFNPTKATRLDVGWCSNDYQIDTGTPEGRTEYKRLLDACYDLGINNILYTPGNNLVAPLVNNTDAWGWENVLWLNMGQQIRTGAFIAATGTMPSSVQELMTYAQGKNVGLVAYVYPSLGFKQNPEWTAWCGGNTHDYVGADTGVRSFQDWLVQQMVDFHNHVGVTGYSFDHWWIAYDSPATSKYAQWYGCRRILENLRTSFPECIIDGRQQYQNFGPWTWLAGSYPHPTSTDEQPASFRAFPDLHTDRVSANRQRFTAYWYRMSQLAPPEITPGYITHQTQRIDGDRVMRRTAFRTRDWDVLGWRFSLFSTIGTAPFNLVMNMLPARDISEYSALSAADKQFFKDWFDWVDAHIEYMRVIRPIIGQPMIGRVDGTAGILNDNGYVFLFNPNYRKLTATFKLDKSIGLMSGTSFIIKELEPRAGRLIGKPMAGAWSYGDTVTIPMSGTTAMVLEIKPAASPLPTTLFNVTGTVALNGNSVNVTGASGEVGAVEEMYVTVPSGTAVNAFSVNGLNVAFTQTGDVVKASARFDGRQFGRCQQIGVYNPTFIGTTVGGTFVIPQRIFNQLQSRKLAWPVTYTAEDLLATWLGSDRLLLYIHIADPTPTMTVTAKINGNPVTVNKAYNGIYNNSGDQTYTGFYLDVSKLLPDTAYQIEVTIPSLAAGQFQGLFFDNVETEYTQTVTDTPPSDLLVKLDAAALPVGALSRWTNTGILGGFFNRDGTDPQVQNVAGRRAVVLSGSDRMLASFTAPASLSGNGHYTVAYWVCNPFVSDKETVVSWAPVGTAGRGACFGYGSNQSDGVARHTGASDMGFFGAVPTANQWHHIAVTFDGATEKIYVDGALNNSESKTLNVWERQLFTLGCANTDVGPASYFSGAISSVMVYNEALGAASVAALAGAWVPQPVVDLDASALPLGMLTTWPNTGSLGGSFGNDSTSLQVQYVSWRPAVTFSGTNRMKSTFTAPATITGNNKWTYAAWVLNPALAAEECVFTWSHRGTTGRNAQMNYGSDTSLGAVAHASLDMGFEGGIPAANAWHHIAVTFDGSTESVYVDGRLNVAKSRTLNIFANDPMYIGCANTGTAPTAYFSGSVAALQVYDKALTATDILTLSSQQDMLISDLRQFADGEMVALNSKSVTLAPKNESGIRSSGYFYIEEADRTCAIRVEDGLAGQDSISDGDAVTLLGTLKTSAAGERYIELAIQPQKISVAAIKPLGITTRTLHKDRNVLAELVTVVGTVREVASDGTWFTMSDGYTSGGNEVQTLVLVNGASLVSSQIAVGQTIPVIGVVSLQGNNVQTAQRVLLMRELPWAPPRFPDPPYSWRTGFETSEGFVAGNVSGQQGWAMGWNPTGAGSATVVTSANGQVASGSMALKMAQPNTAPLPWYSTIFVLPKTIFPAVPNVAMKYLITKMKLYLDGGTTEYPAGSGLIYPNTWFNQFGFYPDTRYIDAGQVDVDTNFHAIVRNTTPRQVGDTGTAPIGGRWVEIVVFDDYINHTRTMLYDGKVVTSKAAISTTADRPGNALNLYYGTAQPWQSTTGLSKPAYVDDIYLGWDLK